MQIITWLLLFLIATLNGYIGYAIIFFLFVFLFVSKKYTRVIGWYILLSPFGWFEYFTNESFSAIPLGVLLATITSLSIISLSGFKWTTSKSKLSPINSWIKSLLFAYVIIEIFTRFKFIALGFNVFGYESLSLINGVSLVVKETMLVMPIFLLLKVDTGSNIFQKLSRYFSNGVIFLAFSIILTLPLNMYLEILGHKPIGIGSIEYSRFYGLYNLKGDGNSASLVLVLFMFYFSKVSPRGVNRLLISLLIFIAILFTGSRTGLILALFIQFIKEIKLFNVKSFLFLFFIIFTFLFIDSGLITYGRFNEIGKEISVDSEGSRLFIYSSYIKEWSKNTSSILFGATTLPKFDKYFYVTHNLWLLLFYNWGLIIGSFVMFSIFPVGKIFRVTKKKWSVDFQYLMLIAFLGLFTVADSGALYLFILISILLYKLIVKYENLDLVKVD